MYVFFVSRVLLDKKKALGWFKIYGIAMAILTVLMLACFNLMKFR